MITDGAIGTAVGVGIGTLGEVALATANVSLFIASPLLAPLMMMGWGATVSEVIKAAVGDYNDVSTYAARTRAARAMLRCADHRAALILDGKF